MHINKENNWNLFFPEVHTEVPKMSKMEHFATLVNACSR